MVLSNGSKILTNKNINKSFFWFCVKKRPLTLLYLFQNLMYYIISIILNNREYYLTRKFKYYKSVKNMKEQIAEFKKSFQITNYFNIKPDFVIEKVPNILLKETFDGYKTIGYSFDKNFNVEIDKFNDDIKKIDINDILYLNRKKNNISVNCKTIIVIHNKHARFISNRENK